MAGDDEILVIGGGVIGVCSAYYLAEAGCPVRLIEKGEICSGASWGNAGFVCPSHSVPMPAPGVLLQAIKWMSDPKSPFYIKPRLDPTLLSWLLRFASACTQTCVDRAMPVLHDLGRASLELHERLAEGLGATFGFRRNGLLMLYGQADAFHSGAQVARRLSEMGVRTEILRPRDLHDRLGDLRCAAVGGVNYPDDGHLDPGEFVQAVARAACDRGAVVQSSAEVLGWETSGRTVTKVRTTRGDFQPRQIVLAAGAWCPSLAQVLDIKLPIQAAKGYSVSFRRPRNCPDVPMLLGETRVAVTPLADTLRLGGTLELAGMDLSVNRPRVDAILEAAKSFLPGLEETELLEVWRGLRPCTPDGLPIIGRCEAFENLIVASGHGTLGVSLGPITGKLVSQIALGQTPTLDTAPLRPDRFS
ncbi:MAG: FAD-dependent oxidoreductase [Phycisphaerae bacterium]|nr:FAD-dependent oxidoreductase [Phycisphaerae bacterium]